VACLAHETDRLTPVLTNTGHSCGGGSTGTGPAGAGVRAAVARLAASLGPAAVVPLAVGRAQRLATGPQRTALALRDKGCAIPGVRREALVDRVEVRDLRHSCVAAGL
jgi:hypothetical protein